MQLPVSRTSEFDDQFDALAHCARRRLLFALYREQPLGDGVVSVADEIVSTSMIAMHHRHLPKLAEYGYVTRDPGSEVIRPGPNFEEIESLLAMLDEHWRTDPDR